MYSSRKDSSDVSNWPEVIDFTARYRGQKMEVSHNLGPLGLVECSG